MVVICVKVLSVSVENMRFVILFFVLVELMVSVVDIVFINM